MHGLKKGVANLIFFSVSTLALISLLEAGTRLFSSGKRPQLIVKRSSAVGTGKEWSFLKPSFEAALLSAEYEIEIKTNSEGFRDVEFPVDKPGGVFRILVAGDSFTYGIGVEASQTYPKVMERILNDRKAGKNPVYEVFNLGVPDIGTLEEQKIIEYGVKYNPDLILLGLLAENRWAQRGNDLCDNFRYRDRLNGEELPEGHSPNDSPGFKSKLIHRLNFIHRFLIENSELYFLVMTRKGRSLRKYLVGFRGDQDQEKLNAAWGITQEALEEINAFARERNLPFVVLYIPFSDDIDREDHQMRDRLVGFSKDSDINLFDLSEVLRQNRDRDLYYQADGHWRPLAHHLSAEATVDYLVEKNFVPGG